MGEKIDNVLPSEKKYEIESIIDDRIVNGKTIYRIHWKGFQPEDDTWEFENNIRKKELIQTYKDEKASKADKVSNPRQKLKKAPILAKLKKKKPKQVISVFKHDKKIYYRVMFEDQSFDSVSSELLREASPDLIFDYLVSHFQVHVSTKQ